MAEAVTRGLQGETLAELSYPDKIVAVLKHCCAQGGCVGGHNAGAAPIGPRELHEIFLPPVQAGVAAGAQCIMVAYNEIDGIPCHANKWLLTSLMREEWGFAGVVMSDGNGIDCLLQCDIDKLPTDATELSKVAAQAIIAGVDFGLWGDAFTTLETAVNDGRCPIEVIDSAVARVLRLKFLLGLFENPFVDEERAVGVVGSIPERESSLQLARETLVLLRNENAALPLSPTLQRIAIIGPNADNLYNQLGDYSAPQLPNAGVTVLQGIQALLPQAQIRYATGCGIRDMDRSGGPGWVK